MDGTLRTKRERDRPFDPSKLPSGDAAKDLLDAFLELIAGFESRKRSRRPLDQARHVEMASALVMDLAHLSRTLPGQWLAVSLDKGLYSPERRAAPFLTEKFIELVNLLGAYPEVLELRRGFQGAMRISGRRTTIRPGSRLLKLFEETGVSLADIGRDHSLMGDPLVLKAPKVRGQSSYLPIPDSDHTRALRAEVRLINGWIASADLGWLGDEEEDKVDLGDRYVRRVFNNASFEDGGRLFGGFWHRKDRLECLLFGEDRPVALDFGQMGVRSAYAMAGAAPPDGDLYAVPGLEGHREGTKKVLSALLAADRIPRSLPKGVRKAGFFPKRLTFERVYEAISEYHFPIKHLFGTSLCFRQMYEESSLLIKILLRLRELGVVALPLHDGILVSDEHRTIAEHTMKELFRLHLGVEGMVDVSFPTTTIMPVTSGTIGTACSPFSKGDKA
jgi:hypothetical protein